MSRRRRKKKNKLLSLLLALLIVIGTQVIDNPINITDINLLEDNYEKEDIPDFDGDYSITINDNKTYFTDEELEHPVSESYSSLDYLDRAGVATATVSKRTLAKTSRGSISSLKPSGWHLIRYDDLIQDKYLYNRSHLIGYQFKGNSTNRIENLVTGTRYFNSNKQEGMLHYESLLREYLNTSSNRVLYRVTPIYDGNDLVAKGVLMEAQSIEDDSFEFCSFVYNEQPGITIDHNDGSSTRSEE